MTSLGKGVAAIKEGKGYIDEVGEKDGKPGFVHVLGKAAGNAVELHALGQQHPKFAQWSFRLEGKLI